MDSAELLRQAIQAARNGRELTARDLFLDVVRLDPNNETAWMWLSGLLDPLDDRIAACERVLSINPGNRQVRAYLDKLFNEYEVERQGIIAELDEEVKKIRKLAENGNREEALSLLQNILREDGTHKEAWLLFADLSVNINDKVRAYEAIVQNDPSDKSAQEGLKQYRYFRRNPLELAASYEEDGELDKAMDLYNVLAIEAGTSSGFERIHRNIVRLEDAKIENLRHIKPSFTILRLSVGLPLLYILEVFIQDGLNPIKHPTPDLWIGIPLVVLGSFLLTVAGIRVRHPIWRRWFGQEGERGSTAMRALVAAAGWMLVLTPHLLLMWDSFLRLQSFQIPTSP
jgi:tetratricopeptide (TPR) repeat protein